MRPARRGVGHAEPIDQLARPAFRVGRAARQARRQQHVLGAGELGNEVEELEDEADQVAPHAHELALGRRVDALPGDGDPSRVRALERGQQVHERRLARARPPDDRDQLARLKLEVRSVEDAARRAPGAVGLDQRRRLDHSHSAPR